MPDSDAPSAGDALLRASHQKDLDSRREAGDGIARCGHPLPVESGGQRWLVAWHPPPVAPAGTAHGAEGICVTPAGQIVVISRDGQRWGFPAGRPEPGESWSDTLRREMLEEACATIRTARLLGFTQSTCVEGRECGLVLVRSVWRADVDLLDWRPEHEIPFRQLADAADLCDVLGLDRHPFAAFIRRAIREAAIGHEIAGLSGGFSSQSDH